MAISITKPTVNGSNNNWGDLLNDALDDIVTEVNAQDANDWVTSARIADGAVDTAQLAADAVTAAKIAADAVGASEIAANAVGASELNVSGNGSSSQFLRSDGDGSFTWATPTDTNTTYTADGNYGMTLSGTAFRLDNDRRRNSSTDDVWTGNTHDYIHFDASVGMRFYTAGGEDMRLTDAGVLHVDSDIIAYSSTISDERLKTNIQPIDDALDKVCQLNGYTFDYIRDNRASAGVIAQEVEAVLPSAITEQDGGFHGEDGQTYKAVQYDQLHGLLIEAIKELKAEIEALKNGG